MRILLETVNGEKTEGTVALKDESFVMIKLRKGMVRVIHWEVIKNIESIARGKRNPVNIDVFRKIRE